MLQTTFHTLVRRPQILDATVLVALAQFWLSTTILSATATVAAGVLFATASLLVLYHASHAGLARSFGLANTITLVRLGLTCVLAAAGLQTGSWTPELGIACAAIAAVVLGLDGIDGWTARRLGTQSKFGARFDMEVDAGFIAALCALVWWTTPVGAWVLSIGLMRYAFVAAGWLFPWLRAELPVSFRRQAVCVAQGIALTTGLVPQAQAAAASCAAMALVLLALSFGLDTIWLYRHQRSQTPRR